MLKLTKSLEKAFESAPLYSKDGQGEKAEVIAKFFVGGATWLITEAEKQGDDYCLYGYSHIFEWEWGYVMWSELRDLKVRGIFEVEQDKHLPKHSTVGDCLKELGEEYQL